MSLASSIPTGIWLSAALAIVGCGSSGTSSNAFRNSGGGSNYDATSSGDDGGSNSGSGGGSSSGNYSNSSGGSNSSSSGGGNACPTSCASNGDCQNSCPSAPSGSSNCCDTTSGTCFVTAMAACPSQSTGAE